MPKGSLCQSEPNNPAKQCKVSQAYFVRRSSTVAYCRRHAYFVSNKLELLRTLLRGLLAPPNELFSKIFTLLSNKLSWRAVLRVAGRSKVLVQWAWVATGSMAWVAEVTIDRIDSSNAWHACKLATSRLANRVWIIWRHSERPSAAHNVLVHGVAPTPFALVRLAPAPRDLVQHLQEISFRMARVGSIVYWCCSILIYHTCSPKIV